MLNKKNNSLKFYITVTFLFSFLPRLILCFFSYPANFPGDEITAAASAATAYGFNWSNVLSIGRYYGQGFTILFTPIYYITTNPIIIFRLMNIVFALLQAFGSLIAFHCLRKYFKITDYVYLSVCAIACSYLLESRATIISNEHPLVLICWLTTWLLLILNSCKEDKKKRTKYTTLLVLILVYSLTLHTRAITFWIALIITVLFYFFVYRKWIVSLPVFAVLGITGTILGSIVIAYIQKTVWSKNDIQALDNASFNINLDSIKLFFSPESWQGWLNIIIGQLNTLYIVTCGFAFIGAVIFIHLIWKSLRRSPQIIDNPESNMLSNFFVIAVFFGVAMLVTICGQSISWLPGVKEGMLSGFGSRAYGFKAFTYFRYFALYTAPLLMITFAYAYLYKDKLSKYFKVCTITMLLLQFYFIICVVPYIYNFQEYVTTLFRPFVFFLTDHKTNVYTFLGSSFTVLITWFIIWFCYSKKKVLLPAIILCCFLIYHYIGLTFHYDYTKQTQRYETVDSSYKLMTSLQNNEEVPKDIYVIAKEGTTSNAVYFIYQFYLNHYVVNPWLPNPNLSEGIAFHSQPDNHYLLDLGYQSIKLDDNEYIYIKGEKLHSLIQAKIKGAVK